MERPRMAGVSGEDENVAEDHPTAVTGWVDEGD
jgi:hypothetical protein